jgi:broad specificity phosphatase PhoE
MSNTIYLVRHGEKERIKGNPPLTSKGQEQAIKTAKFFKNLPISAIFASPILRTQQTAKYIADHLNLTHITHHLLKERANWGDDPNQSLNNFLEIWNQASLNRDWQPPVGDSSLTAGKRIERLIEELSNLEHEHLIFVTHGGIISDFLRNIFDDDTLNNHNPNFLNRDDIISECSITTLTHTRPNSYQLLSLASVNHLG